MDKIEELRDKYNKELSWYRAQYDAYIQDYGEDKSDYLIHRINMIQYYRGAIAALTELSAHE